MIKGLAIVIVVVVVVPIFFILMWTISAYNRLVALRNRYKNAYAQIDVQLKRRYDLIPNLVETAKGYIKHERDTLEAVTAARNIASAANTRAAKSRRRRRDEESVRRRNRPRRHVEPADDGRRILSRPEGEPEHDELTEELTSTENKISFARQAYNDSVMTYNTHREVFPSNLIAGMFNFGAAELFVIDKPEQKEAPKVSSDARVRLDRLG